MNSFEMEHYAVQRKQVERSNDNMPMLYKLFMSLKE